MKKVELTSSKAQGPYDTSAISLARPRSNRTISIRFSTNGCEGMKESPSLSKPRTTIPITKLRSKP